VTFNDDDTNSGPMNLEIASSPSTLSANVFVNTGYTFAGWNTLANGTGTNCGGARYSLHAYTSLDAPK
jgi:hypothetical protein